MSGSRSKGFRLDQVGQKVQSSEIADVTWPARTLLVGTAPISGWTGDAYGSLTWLFQGKGQHGSYDRLFQTAIGQQVQIDIGPYRGWQVTLQQLPIGTPPPYVAPGWVAVQERPVNNAKPSRVVYAARYGAGTWAVPGGATKLYAASAVPSFTWQTQIVVGGVAVTIAIPQALLVGDEFEVRGTHFNINAGADLVWEIQL